MANSMKNTLAVLQTIPVTLAVAFVVKMPTMKSAVLMEETANLKTNALGVLYHFIMPNKTLAMAFVIVKQTM